MAPPRRQAGLPLWLLTVIFAAGFGALGVGAYMIYRHFTGAVNLSPGVSAQQAASAQALPTPSGTPGDKALLEFLEVTGLRLVENRNKKTEVVFVVVNHSEAPLTDLAGTVTLRPSTSKPGKETVGIFGFQHLSLGPNESRELRAPLNTTLRTFELPDWQFLRTDLSLSSPQAGK